ncbi:Rieske (2Fe-2S) protein [Embleya sp. NBC_00896]|uniref:Rieske (2Fe-2S) protein n=1 Tax=Embleya sp. NBC_00896 TaxID=2975961 RepID=UPI003867F6D4|nr:Rieske (2Fe-2S) protein [Embleya sp. NBC_00896]
MTPQQPPLSESGSDHTAEHGTDRRALLRGAAVVGAVGAAGIALTACATENQPASPHEKPLLNGPVTVGRSQDVVVGKGKVYTDTSIVVTQPAKDDYKAFDARCPHQGCLVTKVDQGVIQCQCHGSQFSMNDGSVVRRPAKRGLTALPVKVANGEIIVG